MTEKPKLKAKGNPENTLLLDHLDHVYKAILVFANEWSMDKTLAGYGAVLHDIGKAHPIFQHQLEGVRPKKPFRHELASLFFLPLFSEEFWPVLIEMCVAHHKSIKSDSGRKGILDLMDEYDEEIIDYHLGSWEGWQVEALSILSSFGITVRRISKQEAEEAFEYVVDYCERKWKNKGYSQWRGLLMAADHFASALGKGTYLALKNKFKSPVLSFYDRRSELYPLSLLEVENCSKPHTIVIAPTGAGKTDYLFRRCKGRVFYTLPFQASINAMFYRVQNDLEHHNPNLDIRVLHAGSKVVKTGKNESEEVLQGLAGASIKVLTPHQMAGIVFALKGYEAMLLDLKGCDIILDEVHTYTGVSQAIVLKIVQVLVSLDCRIHIGTATIPTVLYDKILNVLGRGNVLEVSLDDRIKEQFDRHVIHQIQDWETAYSEIDKAIEKKEKILIVCNRVGNAQKVYKEVKNRYPSVDKMLVHSRFKRGDRNKKEQLLIGVDKKGNSIERFNTAQEACLVVSTQIVEVSLDISFDVMITEVAPLDALIQRFGRVHRKRSLNTIGTYKPVYVIGPPEDKKQALPYDLGVLKKSYEVLPNSQVLKQVSLQHKIDVVYPKLDMLSIENHAQYKESGKWNTGLLMHNKRAVLLELLEIDSVSCIVDADRIEYMEGDYETRTLLEIPMAYWMAKTYGLEQLKKIGTEPYVIPNEAYSEYGLMPENLTQNSMQFL
ncbi:CRISPR-associated helicase Cas3' [Algivirga pacifica]|uniref:CRISPR-associated helicase/endonuclease Cas3 n=1 Tax=Algivirga pacifica TaxID=1162670 RepID=A0ABP9DI66_9BACT